MKIASYRRLLCAALVLAFSAGLAMAQEQAQEPKPRPRTLVPAHRLNDAWWKNRHEANKARLEQGNVDFLLVGDSITNNWDNAGKDVQAYYYGDRNYVNMGFGGDQPQHVLWRLNDAPMDKIHPKAAMLLIGVNSLWGPWEDCEKNTALGVKACVDKLRELYPDIQILVLNIFPAGEKAGTELRARITKTNEYVNEMLKDYPNLQIMDLSAYWLDGNGSIPKFLMKDFVHPGQLGYKLWGAAVEPVISSLLGVEAKPVME